MQSAIVAPSGRNDIVGHITDTASLTKGKHDLRFGGEFRQGQIDAFNTGNSTGLFAFQWAVPVLGKRIRQLQITT